MFGSLEVKETFVDVRDSAHAHVLLGPPVLLYRHVDHAGVLCLGHARPRLEACRSQDAGFVSDLKAAGLGEELVACTWRAPTGAGKHSTPATRALGEVVLDQASSRRYC
eukprot:UN2384